MGPSLAGYGWVARASAHRASSGQISLLGEGEHVWGWFRSAETTSQAAVPREAEAAQTRLGPMGAYGQVRTRQALRLGPSRIGEEVSFPSTVFLCRMQLLEERFVPLRK